MTPNPVSLPGTTSLIDAACRMKDDDIGDLAIDRYPHTALADISVAAPNQ